MRASTRPIVALVSAVVVLALVVVASAVGGSWELEDRDFGWSERLEPTEQPSLPPPPPFDLDDVPEPRPLDWSWLGVVVRILLGALAVLVLWWVWILLRDRLAAGSRPEVRPGGAVTADSEPELPVLRRGVAEAQRHLDEIAGAADAVFAAWLALEDAAQASGVRRRPAHTPTEFTVAVLERTAADPDATHELLGLYHRARFSAEPIGDDEVARAKHCLARLAAGWAAVRDAVEPGP